MTSQVNCTSATVTAADTICICICLSWFVCDLACQWLPLTWRACYYVIILTVSDSVATSSQTIWSTWNFSLRKRMKTFYTTKQSPISCSFSCTCRPIIFPLVLRRTKDRILNPIVTVDWDMLQWMYDETGCTLDEYHFTKGANIVYLQPHVKKTWRLGDHFVVN